MNIPAATRIDDDTNVRAQRAQNRTKLKMADMLRIGLSRVLHEFDATGKISAGDSQTSKRKGARKP